MFQSAIMGQDEDFDQEPGEDEIREYAGIIGIDPDKEPELMWIARAGITAPLPPDWKPVRTDEDDLYFFNTKTKETSWEHPSDNEYRRMVFDERSKKTGGSMKNHTTQSSKPGPNAPVAKISQSALNPVKTPAAKLAPISTLPSTIPNSAPPRVGKLSPLAPVVAPVQKSSPINLSLSSTTQKSSKNPATAERPKTSRGAGERPASAAADKKAAETTVVQEVLGGGLRFLKKSEPSVSTGKADVLKVEPPKRKTDFEDSDQSEEDDDDGDETPSSVMSGPLDGELINDSHLILDIDALSPAKEEPKPSKNVAVVSKTNVVTKSLPQATTTKVNSSPTPHVQSSGVLKLAGDPQKSTTQQGNNPPAKQEPRGVVISPKPEPVATASPKPELTAKKPTNEPSKPVGTVVAPAPKPNPPVAAISNAAEEVKLKTDSEKRLKDFKQKLINEEEVEKKKFTNEMNERIKQCRNELERKEKEMKKKLTEQHENDINELKSKLENENEALQKEATAMNVARRKSLTKQDAEDNDDKFAKEKSRLGQEYEIELNKLKADFEAQFKKQVEILTAEKNSKVKAHKDKIDSEIRDETEKANAEKLRKTNALKHELDDIEKNIENEKQRLNKERNQLNENERKYSEDKMKEMREKVEMEVNKKKAELKLANDREIADLQADFENRLAKMRREMKEKQVEEEHKISERAHTAKYEEMQQKENIADADRTLQNLRRELNELSEMAKSLKADFQNSSSTDNKSRRVKKNVKNDEKRKALVKSLDNLLVSDEISSSSSPVKEKLDRLESEDIVSKVHRFLASHEKAGHIKHRSRYEPNDKFSDDYLLPNVSSIGAESKNYFDRTSSKLTLKDSLEKMQKDLNTLSMRVAAPYPSSIDRNIFRLRPKDDVDEFVDAKVRQYFTGSFRNHKRYDDTLSNSEENRHLNVEIELNSLKKWLQKFEENNSNKHSNNASELDDL